MKYHPSVQFIIESINQKRSQPELDEINTLEKVLSSDTIGGVLDALLSHPISDGSSVSVFLDNEPETADDVVSKKSEIYSDKEDVNLNDVEKHMVGSAVGRPTFRKWYQSQLSMVNKHIDGGSNITKLMDMAKSIKADFHNMITSHQMNYSDKERHYLLNGYKEIKPLSKCPPLNHWRATDEERAARIPKLEAWVNKEIDEQGLRKYAREPYRYPRKDNAG